MARRTHIQNLIKTRTNLRQEDARNFTRVQLDAIENAAGSFPYADAMRPYMIPRDHNPFYIWKYILDWITDPQDVQNLWELCDLFRDILRPKYIQARLPQIALHAFDNDLVYSKSTIERLVANHAFRKISLPDLELLKLRRISLLCKKSSDALLQFKVLLSLENVKQIRTTVDEIHCGEINPDIFCPGFLEVNDNDLRTYPLYDEIQPEIKVFSDLVGTLLELAGHRITSFKYFSKQSPVIVYENLMRWMPYLPNLQLVELDAEGTAEAGEPIPSFEDLPPFPTCHQLRSFCQTCCKLPEAYVQRIIVANPLLTTLTHPEWGRDDGFMDPVDMNLRLEHLQCLHTPLYPSLVSYLNYRMPLKEIVILPKWDDDILERFNSAQLCTFLHQFRDTLVRLELRWHLWLWPTGDYLLDLPNLKYFRFKYTDSLLNLNVIASSGRLQEVCMVVAKYDCIGKPKKFTDNFCKRVTTGFGGFSMWEVFPGLRKFVAQFVDGDDEVQTNIEVFRPKNGIR